MPRRESADRAQIVFLYTNIGRGHPFYLDGIVERFDAEHPEIDYFIDDVFTRSRGTALAAWQTARQMYRTGSQGGALTRLYSRFRQSGSGQSRLLLTTLGRDIIRAYDGFSGRLVVAHPILAKILAPYARVVYQHGELVVPDEALVKGCHRILVPLSSTAEVFTRAGIPETTVIVTGQCIEYGIQDKVEAAYEARCRRFADGESLTVALFSSGAYPRIHLDQIITAAVSLAEAGHKPIVFAGTSRKIARWLRMRFRNLTIPVVESVSRADITTVSENIFETMDVFIAPSHERTNWAIGAGLPQLILMPAIGSFAPLNAALAQSMGVAEPLGNDVVGRLDYLITSGKLAAMACAGFHPIQLQGFSVAANEIRASIVT